MTTSMIFWMRRVREGENLEPNILTESEWNDIASYEPGKMSSYSFYLAREEKRVRTPCEFALDRKAIMTADVKREVEEIEKSQGFVRWITNPREAPEFKEYFDV